MSKIWYLSVFIVEIFETIGTILRSQAVKTLKKFTQILRSIGYLRRGEYKTREN